MNKTTLKLLFLLGVISCVLLEVTARMVEQPWEHEDEDRYQDMADSYERKARQPLRYGKRRVLGKHLNVVRDYTFNKEPFNPPPYFQNKNHGGK